MLSVTDHHNHSLASSVHSSERVSFMIAFKRSSLSRVLSRVVFFAVAGITEILSISFHLSLYDYKMKTETRVSVKILYEDFVANCFRFQ